MCIIISTRLDNPVECRSPHVSLPADSRSHYVLRRFMGPSHWSVITTHVCCKCGGQRGGLAFMGGGEACSGSIFATLSYQLPRPIAVYNAFHFFHAPLRLPVHFFSFSALSSPFLAVHCPLPLDRRHGRPIHAC